MELQEILLKQVNYRFVKILNKLEKTGKTDRGEVNINPLTFPASLQWLEDYFQEIS
jgi:hypothetical protein